MGIGCKSQPRLAKFLRGLLWVVVAALCMVSEAAAVKGTGLCEFCGFTAGEMRKDGKVGDLEQIEVKPRTRFRKFEKVGLNYTKSGRLSELCAVEKISGKDKDHSAAKREFDELIKWLEQNGIRKPPMSADVGWRADNGGGSWEGIGEAKTKDAHLEANVRVLANYTDPKLYRGDQSGRKILTGWLVQIVIQWEDVDKLDLTPGATAKRMNRKIPVKTFVEQTFGARFKSTCPADVYDSMMKKKPGAVRAMARDDDASFAQYLYIMSKTTLKGTGVHVSREPYLDVISPFAWPTDTNPNPIFLPSIRLAYGKYLTKPVCHAESVMFAYSNPKDANGEKAPVNSAEDLSLSAIVLWGTTKNVKDSAKATSAFCGSVKSWLGIEFSETNITEKSTSMTFHDGDFTVMARTFVNSKSGRIELEYYVAISDVPMNSPEQLPLPNGNVASGSGGGGVKEGLEGVMSAWMTDCGEALKAARAAGKLLLVYNGPRDWLRRQDFPSDPEFLSYATNRYVLLTVDGWGEAEKSEFPWAYSAGYPACRILDPEGELLSPDGSRRLKGWPLDCSAKGGQMLELLKGFDKARLVMPGALPKNREEPSLAELSNLHNALSQLPESFVNTYYLKWAERLVVADPDGSKGYRVCYPYAAKVYPRIKELVKLKHNYYSALYDLERKRIKDARDEQDGRYRGKNLRDIVAGELAEEWEPKFVDAISQLDKMDEEVPDGDSRFRFDNFKRDVGSVLNKLREARKASN